VVLARRLERIANRHKRILDWLDQNRAVLTESGRSADEISNAINEPVSTIRIDLKSMAELVTVDEPYALQILQATEESINGSQKSYNPCGWLGALFARIDR